MLTGKKVFISGGTGYLGEAICKKCLEYNAAVFFSYYTNELKAQEMMKLSEQIKGIKLDIKNVDDINQKIDYLHKEVESFDILINNAGASQIMPFSMLEEDDLQYLYEVNMKGTIFLTKAIVRKMLRNKSGVIVNVGSIAGSRMFDVPIHYAVTKSSINGFTFSLAAELKRFNIRVNSVLPGMLEDGVASGIPDDMREAYLKHCAAGRAGKAEEVAEVICFLASQKASYINAQNICVDGGI